jgi:hypothetical protein
MRIPKTFTALAVAAMFACNAVPALAALTLISGYAYGEKITTTTGSGTMTTSGPLPEAGPYEQPTAFSSGNLLTESVSVPDLLEATNLNTGTSGSTDPVNATNNYVDSYAQVNEVNALSGTFTTTNGQITYECLIDDAGNASLRYYFIVNGFLAGNPLSADTGFYWPEPNTRLDFSTELAGGTAILNEQFYDAITNRLTANGVHLHVTSGTLLTDRDATAIDITLAHVECDALPAGTPPVIPETPFVALLPLTALAVIGGAIFLSSRGGRTTLRSGR